MAHPLSEEQPAAAKSARTERGKITRWWWYRIKGLTDKHLISAADLEKWKAYQDEHYASVKEGTWDKIIAADGWEDGIKH